MNYAYDEIVEEIINSGSQEDWIPNGLSNQSTMFTYKEDVRLRIENVQPLEEGSTREQFYDEWANNHPDREAYRDFYQIYFNASLIKEVMLVSVDGGRASMPVPETRDNLIVRSALDLAVARIVDSGQFDHYFELIGFKEK